METWEDRQKSADQAWMGKKALKPSPAHRWMRTGDHDVQDCLQSSPIRLTWLDDDLLQDD
jgi:hypothetical protein